VKTFQSYYHKCPCCYRSLHWGLKADRTAVVRCEFAECLLFHHASSAPTLREAFEKAVRHAERVTV
jgi:hypothetical protein